MADISAKTWSNAGVSVINIHENDNANKTILRLLCISDMAKRLGGKNIYGLIKKKLKENTWLKIENALTKPQIKKYKIDRARLFKNNKHSLYVHEDIAITIIIQSKINQV